MTKLQTSASLIAAFCTINAKAQVPPFVNPPVSSYNSTWIGQALYQRDVYWNFAVNPISSPTPTGIPGAAYSGTLDSLLWGSDYVTVSGNAQYFSAAQSPDGIAGIGIDNTGGGGTLSGTVKFYLASVAGSPENNIWAEDTIQTAYAPTIFSQGVQAPGFSVSGGLVDNNSWQVVPGAPSLGIVNFQDIGDTVTPNPPLDDYSVGFQADPGSYIILNSLQIATQSVPEPPTIALLVLGASILLIGKQTRSISLMK